MNEMEKYLDAITAAVESKNKTAMMMLERFTTYVYQEISAKGDRASGEERAAWEGMRKRAQDLIVKMSQSSPDIWG